MLRPRAGSEVGAAVSVVSRVPRPPPLVGLGMCVWQVSGHTGTTQAHRNTRVTAPEPSPPRTLTPQPGQQRLVTRRGIYSGGETGLLKLLL